MVDIDLRALSAPLESIKGDVDAAYKRLDAQWTAISKQLDKLPIPCDVYYSYYSNAHGDRESSLEWRKWKGKRRICIVHTSRYFDPDENDLREDEDVIPYEEWGGELRLAMLEHVPDLFKSAFERTKRFVDQTKSKE